MMQQPGMPSRLLDDDYPFFVCVRNRVLHDLDKRRNLRQGMMLIGVQPLVMAFA